MSGYLSDYYRNSDCSKGCAIQRQPNLTWMVEGHARGIKPTDVDQMWEAGGQFLIAEVKSSAPAEGGAQLQALKRLSVIPAVTVLVMWPRGDRWMVHIWRGGRHVRGEAMTREAIWFFVEAWIAAADAAAPPSALRTVERSASLTISE